VAGYIATLEHTRLAFSQLAAEMVEHIAQTHMQNCQHDLGARAQVAIDILVRNLFERTADVGFIATDAPLVAFVQAPDSGAQGRLHARLNEYRAKYTVYDDILVLDAAAQVLLSLKARSAEHASERTLAPDWWHQTLSNNGYTEQYGPSALFPKLGPVLLYAHRIVAADGQVCGAVVLKFDLQSELASIFQTLHGKHTVVLLRDARGALVASSDPARFSTRQDLPAVRGDDGTAQTLTRQGTSYLVAHCETRGYQGYGGPGWTAMALIGLDDAFASEAQELAAAEAAPAAGPQGSTTIELDNPQLQQTIARARSIEEDLNRVIWNGKLTESSAVAGSALSPVFAEIGRTSKQTIAVFDDAIDELKALLMEGRRAELRAHAQLAVDIMDRNLYERANDCRWWALSEELAALLQVLQGPPDAQAQERAVEILAHLNSLYTVYRRVALFDRQGRILAVSRDPETLAAGSAIPAALLQRTLALQGTQAYAVSDMQPHALADGAATYLYCAPIRQAGSAQCLGGIALAFHCADELQAMLRDSLPPGGQTHGFFVDPTGRVLSSTLQDVAVGESPSFVGQLQAPAGPNHAHLCEWKGRSYLAGMGSSQGYREFKTTDGYRDAVQSVLLTPVDLGAAALPSIALPQRPADSRIPPSHFGVVQCGRLLFGLGSADVVEAVVATHLSAPPVASESVGMLTYSRGSQSTLLAVYDACVLTGQPPITDPSRAVAIVVRRQQQTMALLVNRLIDVIASDPIAAPPGGVNPQAPWISGYIHDQQAGTEPVFTIDPNLLEVSVPA
jgi:ribosomal protein S7/chemotaxis signal transduction protein